jgi:hypothetical protein
MITPIDAETSYPENKMPKNWYVVTNHLNLFYMMGAGLIISQNGFGEKYFTDSISMFNEHILLFADNIPFQAIDRSTKEMRNMIGCVANIHLDNLTGPVATINEKGDLRQDVRFPDGLKGDEAAIIIPAPLPITWLDIIYVNNNESKKRLKESADELQNVPYQNFEIRVNGKFFKKPKSNSYNSFPMDDPKHHLTFPWPNIKMDNNRTATSFGGTMAVGGILGVLCNMAEQHSFFLCVYQRAFNLESEVVEIPLEPLTQFLIKWFNNNDIQKSNEDLTIEDLTINMFGGILNALADSWLDKSIKSKDVILNFFEEVTNNWEPVTKSEKLSDSIKSLTHSLQSFSSMADKNLSELLDQHPKWFSRALILFFAKDRSQDLLVYSNEKLNPEDIIAAAILFGARDGWMGLHEDIKRSPSFQNAVIHRMVANTHHAANTGLEIGVVPPPPPLIRELFKPVDEKWTTKQQKAALMLAKQKKWDGIQTIINLTPGEYQINVTRSGMQVIIPGFEKGTKHQIDQDDFLKQLEQALATRDISGRLNTEVRKILGCPE